MKGEKLLENFAFGKTNNGEMQLSRKVVVAFPLCDKNFFGQKANSKLKKSGGENGLLAKELRQNKNPNTTKFFSRVSGFQRDQGSQSQMGWNHAGRVRH